MASQDSPDLTALLEAWGRGDLAARDQLMPEREWLAARVWLFSRLKGRRRDA